MKGAWWTKKEDLDEDQRAVLRLPSNGSYLVTGPPGCGKTNLVILRAKYLINSGRPNIRVVVFTRALKEFIAFGSGEYGIPSELVMTADRLYGEFLQDQGIRLDLPSNFVERREVLLTTVEKIVEEREIQGHYDTVLVDESQDLLPREVNVLASLGKQLFAVADSRQKIYSGANSIPTIRAVVDETKELRYHYRNGPEICRFADFVGRAFGTKYQPLEPDAQYDDEENPSEVQEAECATVEAQLEVLVEKLEIHRQSFPGELLGVLVPRKETLPVVCAALDAAGFTGEFSTHGGGSTDAFSDQQPICVSTMHSAKGLEFRTLHLIGLDQLNGMGRIPNVVYTAITRAKTTLVTYHCGGAPTMVLQALRDMKPPPEPPTLDSLFEG